MKFREIVNEIIKYDYNKIRLLIEDSTEILREQWRGGLIKNIKGEWAAVIGDIHGDFHTLNAILNEIDVINFLSKNNMLIFLGDVVDRGNMQIECINLVLKLKVLYPNNVIIIRGNHESPPGLLAHPHDFPHVLKLKYGDEGKKLYSKYFSMFQILPHALTTNNSIFLVHGGLPPYTCSVDDFINPSLEILEYLLWSDPFEGEGYRSSYRGAGILFGKDITKNFLHYNNLNLIIRGHEPCDGYKINHDGLVLTLFSRIGEPYFNVHAGYLVFPLNRDMSPIDIVNNVKLIEKLK